MRVDAPGRPAQLRAMRIAWALALGLCACGSRSPLQVDGTRDGSPAADSGQVADAAADAGSFVDATADSAKPPECYSPNVVVMAKDESPTAIAVDASHVYWAVAGNDCKSGFIRRMPKAGGPVVTLAADQPNPRALAVDQHRVYFYNACGSGLLRDVPKQGGPVFDYPIAVSDSGRAMAVGSQDVYFSDYGLLRIPKGGGKQVHVDSKAFVYAVAADASGAYWMGPAGGAGNYAVLAHQPGEVGATVLTNPSSIGNALAIDGESIFFAASPGIRRIPKTGGAASTVVPAKVWRLAVDEASVYWTDGFTGGAYTVNKAPKAGGTATVIASGAGGYVDIAVDDRCVYWADLYGGEIVRAPK